MRIEIEAGNIQENRYDSEGLRYELLENGRRTSFVYHNGELLYEKGGETGLSREEISYHLGAGIDAFQRNQKTFYYNCDEQLSTILISDGNGEIKNQYQYDAFGVGLEALEEFPNRIRYTGQQYDQLTEQYYLRVRYYNPIFGRFMQEDVYQGDGLNLYAYCHNNPVKYCDPSGYNVTDDPVFNSQEDFDKRFGCIPADETAYGKWDGERGNSNFIVYMHNPNPSQKIEKLIEALNKHGTNQVRYKNAMIDLEDFAVFRVDTEIHSSRIPTHSNSIREVAETILKYDGNYEKMYNENVMGIANGTKYSQEIAKEIITSESINNALKASDKDKMKKLTTSLRKLKRKYELTIHEENLGRGKSKNPTDWVSSGINNGLNHLGGTSEQGTIEQMKQNGCPKKK